MKFITHIEPSLPLAKCMKESQGWTLTKTTPLLSGHLILTPISLILLEEERIEFDTLSKRAELQGAVLCQQHAEHLLNYHADLPEMWKSIHLIFPGTIWQNGAFQMVPVIHQLFPGFWVLYFRWTGHGFTDRDYVVGGKIYE